MKFEYFTYFALRYVVQNSSNLNQSQELSAWR